MAVKRLTEMQEVRTMRQAIYDGVLTIVRSEGGEMPPTMAGLSNADMVKLTELSGLIIKQLENTHGIVMTRADF